VNRCSRCVTPESYPRTTFDADGVCNHCLEYEAAFSGWDDSREAREKKFERMVNRARKRSKIYDVLVPLSGGKDSTYVLYLASKKYKLKVLCYNFDNGFQSDIARQNIRGALEASGADLFTFKPGENLMMKLNKHFLKHTGMFCPVCMRGIYLAQFVTARQFKIPLVLKGTSRRTEETLVPEIFQEGTISFFKNVLKEHPFDEDIRAFYVDRTLKEKFYRALYILSGKRIVLGSLDVQVPDFLPWDYKVIYDTITSEMGWQALPDRDEHVDCQADPAMHYLREVRCKDLTPNTLRYSAEIRSGGMDRETALRLVEEEERAGYNPSDIEYFLNRLEISRDELDIMMRDNRRHMTYQKEGGALLLFNMVRKTLGK